jgi:hypothetical protein
MPRKPLDPAAVATLAAVAQLTVPEARIAGLAAGLDANFAAFDRLDAVDVGETPPTNSFDARWRDAP